MVPDYLFKVAKKKQNFGKVARSCSSAKKLLRGQKVAKKLPSTIWLCLGVGTGGAQGARAQGACAQGARAPPPNFFKGLKVPFFVTKSAIFVQANVAVNAKLTSKVPFLFGNFQVLLKYLVQNVQFRYGTTGKIPPCRQHFREKVFRCPFQYPKVPLEAGAPQSFDASYAPGHLTNIYCPTVGHLIENLLKKSNAPPMPDPPPLWGLTLIGA